MEVYSKQQLDALKLLFDRGPRFDVGTQTRGREGCDFGVQTRVTGVDFGAQVCLDLCLYLV